MELDQPECERVKDPAWRAWVAENALERVSWKDEHQTDYQRTERAAFESNERAWNSIRD